MKNIYYDHGNGVHVARTGRSRSRGRIVARAQMHGRDSHPMWKPGTEVCDTVADFWATVAAAVGSGAVVHPQKMTVAEMATVNT